MPHRERRTWTPDGEKRFRARRSEYEQPDFPGQSFKTIRSQKRAPSQNSILSQLRGERRSEGVPSRHGAAQRLAFACKGEGCGRHCICEPSIGACPTYVAAASHAARFEISYLQRLTLPGGAMRWRSYRRGGMTWTANWHCGVNTNVANCRTGS